MCHRVDASFKMFFSILESFSDFKEVNLLILLLKCFESLGILR